MRWWLGRRTPTGLLVDGDVGHVVRMNRSATDDHPALPSLQPGGPRRLVPSSCAQTLRQGLFSFTAHNVRYVRLSSRYSIPLDGKGGATVGALVRWQDGVRRPAWGAPQHDEAEPCVPRGPESISGRSRLRRPLSLPPGGTRGRCPCTTASQTTGTSFWRRPTQATATTRSSMTAT